MRSVLLLLIQLSKSSKELLQDISTFLLLGKSTLTKEFTTTPLLNSLLKEISEMVELISLLTEPAQSISNLPEIPLMSSNISKKMEIFESLANLPPLLRPERNWLRKSSSTINPERPQILSNYYQSLLTLSLVFQDSNKISQPQTKPLSLQSTTPLQEVSGSMAPQKKENLSTPESVQRSSATLFISRPTPNGGTIIEENRWPYSKISTQPSSKTSRQISQPHSRSGQTNMPSKEKLRLKLEESTPDIFSSSSPPISELQTFGSPISVPSPRRKKIKIFQLSCDDATSQRSLTPIHSPTLMMLSPPHSQQFFPEQIPLSPPIFQVNSSNDFPDIFFNF